MIEFLLYIVIVGLILFAAGAISLNVLLGKAKLTAIEEVNYNTRFITDKIMKVIRNAESINSPSAGMSASTLSLQVADMSKNPTVFDVVGGVIRIKEGSGPVVAISSGDVIVSDLQFLNISYVNTPGTVKTQIAIEYTNPDNMREYEYSRNFSITNNIKQNY